MEQEAAAFAARLEGLEVHLAHISKANEDLSDMVAQHQKDLARLARMVEMLAAREAEREAVRVVRYEGRGRLQEDLAGGAGERGARVGEGVCGACRR